MKPRPMSNRPGLKSDVINAADPIDEPSSLWVNVAASVSGPDGREFDPSRPNPLPRTPVTLTVSLLPAKYVSAGLEQQQSRRF